jgi:hypothetical protein
MITRSNMSFVSHRRLTHTDRKIPFSSVLILSTTITTDSRHKSAVFASSPRHHCAYLTQWVIMLTPLLIVAGIGEGLLVIFIALAISGFLCFYGLKTTKPGTLRQSGGRV